MLQASGGGQLGERAQHRAMTIANPLGLVLDGEGAAARLVVTPVGQRSVWQLRDWMQPMNPRIELHQSAPSECDPPCRTS
jgi:hypothetical protein